MIWRLSGWSSTTKMRLLIPFPPAARLRPHYLETKMLLRSLPFRSPAMLLLHAFRARRGVVHAVLKFPLIGSGNAGSGITHRHMKCAIVRFGFDGDFARISELNGVANEVDQHLR